MTLNPEKMPRILMPPEVRKYVFKRDRHQCKACGKKPPEVKLQVDHIIPLAKGGTNDISNLQTLCQGCNLKKGDRIYHNFQRLYSS